MEIIPSLLHFIWFFALIQRPGNFYSLAKGVNLAVVKSKSMKVLVVGSGAREHALGWKIRESKLLEKLFFAPGNSGTAPLGENVALSPSDVSAIADWAFMNKIDLTVVGPENALLDGIAEAFSARKLLLFGPSRRGATLEGSKIWSKTFMQKYGIPTAAARSFQTMKVAGEFIRRKSFPLVIKADGLAQGKGVVVCQGLEEADKTLRAFMEDRVLGDAGGKILVEEFLEGEEISCFAVLDGKTMAYLGEARDYKRALDGDKGPNTGGMGSVSSSDLIGEKLRKEIIDKVFTRALNGLQSEGIDYQGVLYAGLMLTSEGPKVLEFNARFGDPETQVLLPRLDEDFLAILHAAASGNLAKGRLALKKECSLGVVVAAEGYPGNYQKGNSIPDVKSGEVLVFYAGTSLAGGKTINGGGRTLTAVAVAPTFEQAREKAYRYLDSYSWNRFFYRKDIGKSAVPLSSGG